MRKAQEVRAQELVSALCDKVITADRKKEAARDVASIALKTCIAEVQGLPVAGNLSKTIANKMLAGTKLVSTSLCSTLASGYGFLFEFQFSTNGLFL